MVHRLPAHTMLIDVWKGGYWFMLTLFEYMVAQTIVECLTNATGSERTGRRYAATLIAMAAVLYLLSIDRVVSHDGIVNQTLQLSKLRYFVYFAAGRLVRIHMQQLLQWKGRQIAVTVIIVAFIVLAIGSWGGVGIGTGSGPWFYIRIVAFEMTAVLSFFFIFYRHRAWFAADKPLPRTLSLVGQRTLEIYLMHYFLLPNDLQFLGRFFSQHHAMVIEILIVGTITITIAALCMLVGEMIRSSSFLHHWMLGGK